MRPPRDCWVRCRHWYASGQSLSRALARSLYHAGQKEKGRAALQQLLAHPAGPQGVLLGAQIADEMHDYATAEKLLLSIKPAFPDQATVGYQLALVQFHAKGFAEAQRTLQNLIDSGYKSGKVSNLLGWCYLQQHSSRNRNQIISI